MWASDNIVMPEILPPIVKKSNSTHMGENPVEDFEKPYLVEVLKNFTGNISRSADHSGINRRSLHRLLSKYHIDAHQVAAKDEE